MLATACLIQSFIMMHGDTRNINILVQHSSAVAVYDLLNSMYTGVGRVGFHGNMFTQCNRLFWTNSLIGGFTTGRQEYNN